MTPIWMCSTDPLPRGARRSNGPFRIQRCGWLYANCWNANGAPGAIGLRPPPPLNEVWRSRRTMRHCWWSWRICWRMGRTGWIGPNPRLSGLWLCSKRPQHPGAFLPMSGPPRYQDCVGRRTGLWAWLFLNATMWPARSVSLKRLWPRDRKSIRRYTTGSAGCTRSQGECRMRVANWSRRRAVRTKCCGIEPGLRWPSLDDVNDTPDSSVRSYSDRICDKQDSGVPAMSSIMSWP